MNIRIACMTFAAALAAVGAVSAKEKYREVVNAETQARFDEITAAVREDMEPGGRYEYVTADERVKVDHALTDMDALFAKSGGSVAQMPEADKIALFNAQEIANSILTKRDGDRVICQSRAPIGSHIPKTSCHTYAQEQEARRGTTKYLNDMSNKGCAGGTAGRPCMPGSAGAGQGP